MTDTQVSGNEFSGALKQMMGETNYYLKSGYFNVTDNEIKIIKSLYSDLYFKILKLKANRCVEYDLRTLYKEFCRVKYELESSLYRGIPIVSLDSFSPNDYKISPKISSISKLYKQCVTFLFSCDNEYTDAFYNFDKRDVLIGPLRNRFQLEVCLEKKFYHIPLSSLTLKPEEVKYVTLYQSKNFYGKNAGVRYYGKVDSFEILKRCDITEIPKQSDSLYCKFSIRKWESLPHTIKMSGQGAPFSSTSIYLLHNADDICELNFKDKIIYKLYRTILKSVNENLSRVATHYRNIIISAEDGNVNVYKNKRRVYSVSFENYLKSPGGNFWKIISFTKDEH